MTINLSLQKNPNPNVILYSSMPTRVFQRNYVFTINIIIYLFYLRDKYKLYEYIFYTISIWRAVILTLYLFIYFLPI